MNTIITAIAALFYILSVIHSFKKSVEDVLRCSLYLKLVSYIIMNVLYSEAEKDCCKEINIIFKIIIEFVFSLFKLQQSQVYQWNENLQKLYCQHLCIVGHVRIE